MGLTEEQERIARMQIENLICELLDNGTDPDEMKEFLERLVDNWGADVGQ